MAFGILEPRTSHDNVPGTSYLDVHEEASVDNAQFLKKGTGRNAHVVLIPQPSDDPNDPLNWPIWQRDLILLLLTVCTLLCIGGFGSILSPIAGTLAVEFQISFTQVSILSGSCLCATGAIGVFVAASCRKFGRRPALLFSMTSALVGCLWAGEAKSYASMVGARVFQGFSMAFFESVMFSVIGDMYHVHERGTRTAAYITMFSGISNLPLIIAGVIDEDLGWRWIFRIMSIFFGVCLILVVIFGWETAYNRDPIYDVDSSDQNNLQMIEEMKMEKATNLERVQTAPFAPRDSITRRMAPWSGKTYTDVPLWRLVATPFLISYNPAVIWATITIAFPVLWVIGITLVVAQLFSGPPYNFSPKDIGYLSAGPVVVGMLANLICAVVSDWSVKWLSRRNKGVYEPEFRLFTIVGLVVCAAAGYFPFGWLISRGSSAVVISVVYGIVLGGCQFSAVTVGTYIVDAYRSISVDVFINGMVIKNFIFFGFSHFLNDWVSSQGAKYFFYTVGGIQLALCLLTIPLYIYGKRLRAWWHESHFAQLL